ncbi:MAG: YbhB/YbcL family Raf kinase inhibitor-like protein [Pelolinea sp.]|nr:YbhB/YbcL family Raf kinase inhibitor-like protein [Pelolinea sp.]
MKLSSPAFSHQELIPSRYTCDGKDVSPPLEWRDLPHGAQSLALIMDDPDAPAGIWVHWIIFNIPPEASSIAENCPKIPQLSDGSLQGRNSWRQIGYGGPCPPSGTHRYFFKLYALDKMLKLDAGITKDELLKAMEGCVLEQAELIGRYQRTR